MKTFIYGLVDPRDDLIHYIGKPDNLDARLKQHFYDDVNPYKHEWLLDMKADGFKPKVRILEEVNIRYWREAESEWIAGGLARKWPLTNIVCNEHLSATADHSFFKGYLPEFVWTQFESLPVRTRDQIVLATANRMAKADKGCTTEVARAALFEIGQRAAFYSTLAHAEISRRKALTAR